LPSAAENPNPRIICYVTDADSLLEDSRAGDRLDAVLGRIRDAVAAGADWVQIREKNLPSRALLALTREAVGTARQSGTGKTRVIVNDRLDVALASDASGVHLGGQSLPAFEVVRWCRAGRAPAGFLIGVSCHGLEQAREAEGAGANYIFFGPVFDTPSKRPFGPPQGVRALTEVCRAVRIPVIAIGGLNLANAAGCVQAGAAGIAAIRLFQESYDPQELQKEIERIQAGG
jgi:thiamine-phosphate pyrophosphorylase